MNSKRLFIIMSTFASSLAIWLYILTQIPADPQKYSVIALFFVSFALWLGLAIGGGLYFWRVKRGNREIIFAHVKPALRQGIIIAATLSLLLVLKTFNIIGVWEVFLVIVAGILFEIALSTHTKTPNRL